MAFVNGTPKDEFLEGSAGEDRINGYDGSDYIYGAAGTDRLNGGSGDDTLDGGPGIDALKGGAGDDTIFAITYGDDVVDALIDGGDGSDFAYVDWSQTTAGVTLSISQPWVEQAFGNTVLAGIERLNFYVGSGNDDITGGQLNDEFFGNAGDDVLHGGGGDDYLDGGKGTDSLFGGAGNDSLSGNAGDTVIDGGAGIDLAFLDFSRTATGVTIKSLAPAVAQKVGGTTIMNVEQIAFYGSDGDDRVSGGALDDTLAGNGGADRLNGGDGDDFIYGGAGKDILIGGAGHDVFSFYGNDSRTGGGARDVIIDLERGVDKIDLSRSGLESFSQLTFKVVGSGLIVYGDYTGNGLDDGDFGLQLTGVSSLNTSDFIFA